MKTLIVMCLCTAAAMAAAQQPTPAAPPKPAGPVISDALAKDYFKARDQIAELQRQLQDAQQSLSQTVAHMQEACGAAFQLRLGPTGDPVCAPADLPAPKKPAVK